MSNMNINLVAPVSYRARVAAASPGDVNGDRDSARYQAITRATVESMPQWRLLTPELQEAIQVVSLVFPFKTNQFVTSQLIDWSRVPDDPIYQLTFPQAKMLAADDYQRLRALLRHAAGSDEIAEVVRHLHDELNPHPAGQTAENVPLFEGQPLQGVQHKYRQSVLFFPEQGQTCHAYCTFCFRWPQFVGRRDLRIAARDTDLLVRYLRANPHVSDVIFTGGDPLVMKTAVLRRLLEPILDVDSVTSIRIGSKALAYWPQRFVSDADGDDLLRLFEHVVKSRRHLALMAHFSHPVELANEICRQAVSRIRGTGAVIRTQSPVLRHINDDPTVWSEMWSASVRQGMTPYYMFVERDTGPRAYFDVPLVRGWNIFTQAYRQVPGIARTARGPVMSCYPGKCHVLGVLDLPSGKAFALEFLQARRAELVRRPFCARFDADATWFDQLQPLGDADRRFFSATVARDSTSRHLPAVRHDRAPVC